ncbi:MAG TPA: SHOCT domain-containing protein [Verrucomicrobiae bacterium]|nr:SHOCT domain-containing protein [Verrucomicrobiae bacterium]
MKEIAQLDQSRWYKGKRRLTLQDDGIIRIFDTQGGRLVQLNVDVAQLNPEPVHEKRRASSMIVGMVIFGLPVTMLALTAALNHPRKEDVYAYLGFAAFLCFPFLLCLYEYLKRTYDILVFCGYNGGRIVLDNGVPSPEAVASFVERLRSEIRSCREKLPSFPKSLTQELEALGKLRERGVLTEAEFSTAKEQLINSGKARASIGFA